MMAEAGVDPASVEGTGRGGRVDQGRRHRSGQAEARRRAPRTADRRNRPRRSNQAHRRGAAAEAVGADAERRCGDLAARPEQRVPMSRLRARIAERLVQSQSTAAILTTFNEVNMQPVIDLRNRYKDRFEKEHGVKLGFMSFFVKAAVYALKKYPGRQRVDRRQRHRLSRLLRHRRRGRQPARPGRADHAQRRPDESSPTSRRQIADFGKRAQDGKLTIEELTGGTFSISNGGVFGSMLSTPIINPPQSAILGVHATKERAVVENGQVVVRPMNYLALSYDHRIIDGREAVLSLVAMKDALEDPARMLLEL